MPRTFNAASYRDCHFVMEAAINRDGLQYVCSTVGAAINFKQRCNRYRSELRRLDAERMAHIPGYSPESPFDALRVRQVNAFGDSDAKGAVIQFDHSAAGEGKLIDPSTGEEIEIPNAFSGAAKPDETGFLPVPGQRLFKKEPKT